MHPAITAQSETPGLFSLRVHVATRAHNAKTVLGQVIYGHDVMWNEPAKTAAK